MKYLADLLKVSLRLDNELASRVRSYVAAMRKTHGKQTSVSVAVRGLLVMGLDVWESRQKRPPEE